MTRPREISCRANKVASIVFSFLLFYPLTNGILNGEELEATNIVRLQSFSMVLQTTKIRSQSVQSCRGSYRFVHFFFIGLFGFLFKGR